MNEGYELPASNALPNPFRDPLGVLERHWRPMLGVFSLGLVASLLLWSCSAPRYFAEATVVVARQPSSQRILEPGLAENGSAVNEALAAEVLSRANLAQLVSEFDLYPERAGIETTAEIVERVRSHVTINAVQRLDPAASNDAYERAYSIGFEAATPEAASGVANRLAKLFAETSSAGRLQEQQSTLDLLHRELSSAERELQDQSDAITEFRKSNRGLLPEELEANLSRLQTLDERRSSLASEIAGASAQIATLSSSEDGTPRQQLVRMREELSRLRVHKTSRHPDVLTLERQIADLEQRIKQNRARSPRSSLALSEQTIHVLRQQLAATETELTELDAQIRKMSPVQDELKKLEEREAILRENYLEALRNVQNAELGGKLLDTQQGRRVSVLNTAEPPSQPYRTPFRILALGFLASLGGALAVGLGRELLHPVVVGTEDITAISGQPVLGWVMRIR